MVGYYFRETCEKNLAVEVMLELGLCLDFLFSTVVVSPVCALASLAGSLT